MIVCPVLRQETCDTCQLVLCILGVAHSPTRMKSDRFTSNQTYPVAEWNEHVQEVLSVDWSCTVWLSALV